MSGKQDREDEISMSAAAHWGEMEELRSYIERRTDERLIPLKSFKIKNFKSVREAEVEFKPLTVIVGSNSAGKSSLLQAIKLMSAQFMRRHEDTKYVLNFEHLKLGKMEDILNWSAVRDQAEHIGKDEDLYKDAQYMNLIADLAASVKTLQDFYSDKAQGIISELGRITHLDEATTAALGSTNIELSPTFQWVKRQKRRTVFNSTFQEFHPDGLSPSMGRAKDPFLKEWNNHIDASWKVEIGQQLNNPRLVRSETEISSTAASVPEPRRPVQVKPTNYISEHFLFADPEDPEDPLRYGPSELPWTFEGIYVDELKERAAPGEGTLNIKHGQKFPYDQTWDLVGATVRGGLIFDYYEQQDSTENIFWSIQRILASRNVRIERDVDYPIVQHPVRRHFGLAPDQNLDDLDFTDDDDANIMKAWFFGFLKWLTEREDDEWLMGNFKTKELFFNFEEELSSELTRYIGRYVEGCEKLNLSERDKLESEEFDASAMLQDASDDEEFTPRQLAEIENMGDDQLIEFILNDIADGGELGDYFLNWWDEKVETVPPAEFHQRNIGTVVVRELSRLFSILGESELGYEFEQWYSEQPLAGGPGFAERIHFFQEDREILNTMRTVRHGIQEVLGNLEDTGPLRGLDSLRDVASTIREQGALTRSSGFLVPDKDNIGEFRSSSDVTLNEALGEWLRWFGLAEEVVIDEDFRDANSIKVKPIGLEKEVGLASVGVGVSQSLEPIIDCLISESGQLILLEQPELHLHPALQKKMAEFLLIFAEHGRQIIVETHGEHVVTKLRTLAAEDTENMTHQNIQLLFAAKDDDGNTEYTPSEINQYGGVSEDWPDGFLDESAKSSRELLAAGLEKRKSELEESSDE